MKKPFKDYITPFLPRFFVSFVRELWEQWILKQWINNDSPVPPPHIVKQLAIEKYRTLYGFSVFIETGTYKGGMVEAQRKRFKKIISIELDPTLCKNAQKRFKNDAHITIVGGDSGTVLPRILKDIHEPAIFWLDGHYSAGVTAKGNTECPIFEELNAILHEPSKDHIIVIDDARCFIGDHAYPSIDELTRYIREKNNHYHVEIENDIIRYIPEFKQ
jgi:hypothetical protein